MDRRTMWIAGGALALAVIGGGAGIAIGASAGDDEPLTGSALDRASAAALAHTGGGEVIETEVGDGSTVEVRLDDGSTVEVSLDSNFNVTGQEADDDGSVENTGPGDD
jgi:ferric-dicitrate binding protein FerR (iron transport regulator)